MTYLPNIKTEEIINLYDSGKSLSEISNILKMSPSAARIRMKKAKVSLRSRSEATKLSLEGGKTKVLRGKESPAWKGGKSTSGNGYVYIYAPEHPKANIRGHTKYIAEHILIWEQNHRKPLPNGWEVHHINGIRNDNRPENLLAVSRKSHHTQMKPYQERIRQLENEIKELKQNKLF